MLGRGLNKYQGTGADALQRPLRARFWARLTASVRRPKYTKGNDNEFQPQ
jgi:hypothetical protein